jgi:hypothetical protein
MNFTEKLQSLSEWLPILFNQIKEQLKQFLARSKAFYILYFPEAFEKYKTKDGKADVTPLTLRELLVGFKKGTNHQYLRALPSKNRIRIFSH